MGEESKNKTYRYHSSDFGIIWLIGWIFSIGFLKLAFWKAVLALLIWPYYLGDTLNQFLPGGK
jgi:uncharacterized membrane protein